MIICPVCHTENALAKNIECSNCGENLTSLGRMMELPFSYYNQGLRLAQEEKWDEAIEKLAAAAELKKGYSKPLVLMGKIYVQKGMYQEAIACWERVLEIEPNNAEVKKAMEKAQELMAKPPAAEKPAAPVEGIAEASPVSSTRLNTRFAWGIVGLLMISTAILWFSMRGQQLQIAELAGQVARVEAKTSGDIGSLDKQVQGISADSQKRFQDIIDRLSEAQKAENNILSSFEQRFAGMQKSQTATVKSLKDISRQLADMSSQSKNQLSSIDKTVKSQLPALQERIQVLSGTVDRLQKQISEAPVLKRNSK